jgi:ribosome-associated heat shock protein Hsp15
MLVLLCRTLPSARPKPSSGGSVRRRASMAAVSAREARVDQWLWAVRLFKTRSLATEACRGGHVRVNGRPAKPAAPVRAGDRVEAVVAARPRILEVVSPITKRVGPPEAASCLIDHSPPPPPPETEATAWRERGAGRPTKRDRREMERLRRR